MSSREFRHIIRMMGTDLEGTRKVAYGLAKIRGVGTNYSSSVVRAAGIRPDQLIGRLSETDLRKIEEVIKDPARHGIPPRLYNRRKDLGTGRDLHFTGPDLALRIKSDISHMKDIRSWKGVRHTLGLKVRGQRTKTTGRSGKAVGVRKKALIEAARAAAGAREKKE